MPRKMPARALAGILRDRLRNEGPDAADQCCSMIEQLHGRAKLDAVLIELDLILDAEREAHASATRH
jgi:hypothetical protein